jgi:hypothetical protein
VSTTKKKTAKIESGKRVRAAEPPAKKRARG